MQTIQLLSLRHSAFYTPYLMTFVGDFLQQQGLRAEYRCASSVDDLESALLQGRVHVAQSAVGVSMRQLDAQASASKEIKHFAQINQRDGFFIAATPETLSAKKQAGFDWSQLENKRIIADHLFQPMATLKYVLNKHAVDIGSIEFIDAGGVQQSLSAFLAGEADFIHLQGPYPQQLVADAKAVIVASVGKALGDIAYSSLCATSSWLKSPMALQFMRAYKAALVYVQQTSAKQLAKQLSPQFESIQLDTLSETIQAYKDLASWSQTACISESTFDSANKVFLFSGDIDSKVKYSQVVSGELCGMD